MGNIAGVNQPSSPVSDRTEDPEGMSPRILLADDEADVRHLVARALRKDGYEVVEVEDGSVLLHTLGLSLMPASSVRPFDLVISDVRMPRWTGMGVLLSLRHANCAIPFVLITAFGDEETHAEARRLGAAGMLDKPFEIDDLRTLVWNLAPHPGLRRRDVS